MSRLSWLIFAILGATVSTLAVATTTVAHPLVKSLGRVASNAGQVVVVKYGGHAMSNAALADSFAAAIALLQSVGMKPVVVHGGGPQIGAMLEKLSIPSSFVGGLRVTDEATMEIAEMVLAGSINKKIAASICKAGGRALGLTGRDDRIVTAAKRQGEVDLGLVGEPVAVRVDLLHSLLAQGITPVLAPIGAGKEGEAYNINADTMAGAIAAALGATQLLLLTDVSGVLDGQGKLMPTLTLARCHELIQDGTATGGMIPKIQTAMDAVEGGVGHAVVMDGRVPHCTLVHLFGEDAVGTDISA
jgi:acetylglutamate kinase